MVGELCDYVCQWEDFCAHLTNKCCIYFDAFGGSSYPEECRPKQLLPMVAKQLPSYGSSLDTAIADLAHYQRLDFSTLVLCGSRRRAEMLQEMMGAKNLSAFISIPLSYIETYVLFHFKRERINRQHFL